MRVLIVDDHTLVRAGIGRLLQALPDVDVVARHEAEARAAIPDAPTETLSADEVRRAERRPNAGSFEVIVSRLGIVQLNRETHRAIMGGDPAGVEVIPYGGHWRETRRAACPTDDEFPF